MHPHAISQDGQACLYMQDTWLVTADGGVPPRRPAAEDLRRDRERGRERAGASKPVLPGEGDSDYERYLRTDELLALQKTPDEWAHRDELLFQTVHQSSELWLKLAVDRGRGGDAADRGRRPRRRDPAPAPRESTA